MLKTHKLILTLFLSIAVLAACNTTEEPTTEPAGETVTANTEASEIKESGDSEEPAIDGAKKEEQEEEQSTNETNSITFSSNGKSITEDLTPISSERYTIQAIPGFTLTPEEPGKDMLFYDQDESVSMRIEAMDANATTFNELVANTEQTMAAISADYEPYDISPFIVDQNLTKSTAYIANFDTEEVITVVFVKADKLVRLTVFDNSEVDYSEAMIKMGLTIK